MTVWRALACGFGLWLVATTAAAWGEQGHRRVAELAERQLSAKARAAALALLQDEPERSLAAIASWADQVRDDPRYAASKRWHFVNLGADCRFDSVRHCRGGDCVVGAIERSAEILADPTLPRAERAEALKWLVHFVGDIHQPLHCGSADDLGGNRYQIQLDGEGTNLHQVWDRKILDADLPGDGVPQAAPLPAAGAHDPVRWAEQSCGLIRQADIYPPGHRLDARYLQQHRPLAERQLRLAAARLAALIEQAL